MYHVTDVAATYGIHTVAFYQQHDTITQLLYNDDIHHIIVHTVHTYIICMYIPTYDDSTVEC
jgi:hypothetical protein